MARRIATAQNAREHGLKDRRTKGGVARSHRDRPAMTRRVFIECTGFNGTGARYRVNDEDGRVLVASTCDPEFAAARALLAKGVTGQLEVWRASAVFPSMVLDIETAAGLRTLETEVEGPKFVKWRPPPSESALPRFNNRPCATGMALH
jgi:hypothetical protein